MPEPYTCPICGAVHNAPPDLGFETPLHYHALSDRQKKHAVITTETCVIDGKDCFIRGILPIPVHDRTQPFSYGVWVSLSREHYDRYKELFGSRERQQEAPWYGWLANRLPGYPDTINVRVSIHHQPHPMRPMIRVASTDHPLMKEQRDGITVERLHAIHAANAHAE